MRLDAARIAARGDDDLDAAGREALERFGGEQPLAIFRTLANHPDLLRRWLVFANHVLGKSTLPPRERELLILAIGWRCRAGYEWGQHLRIGREAGLTDAEMARIKAGPDAPGWSPADADLLRAVDELRDDAFVCDATWGRLAERWDERQLMDIVFTVGQYNLVSMALNSFGVQPDPGLEGLDDPEVGDGKR